MSNEKSEKQSEVTPVIADKSVFRKQQLVEEREEIRVVDGVPVPTLVELNIYGACNRCCDFCPVSDPLFFTNRQEGISTDLYDKLLRDLEAIDYTGTILFSGFCEPFLHMELRRLVEMTKARLPETRLEIVSNGDLFRRKPERLLEIYDAGLDAVSVSVYDGAQAYDDYASFRDELQLSEKRFILRKRYYDEERGDHGLIVSNRTGLIDSNKFRSEREDAIVAFPLSRCCYYPFYQTMIDYNGDVLLCPHDWGKRYVVGNLANVSFWDLWTNEAYEEARERLAEKDRTFAPCRSCDVYGDVIGEANFNAWKNFSVNKLGRR
jgi:radical SAM protein with 4Fe4S-binding SPASM domain